MIADLADVRTALADALTGIDATVYDTVPATPTAPRVIIGWPTSIQFGAATLSGRSELDITVEVATPLADIDSGQRSMSTLINSVRAALQAAQSEHFKALLVEQASNIRPIETPAGALELLADLTVSLIA